MSDKKLFKRADLVGKNTANETVFVIDNLVYDITAFLDDHPGGHEVLLNVGGKDASEDFDDVGHSSDAKDIMHKYCIGEVVNEDKWEVKKKYRDWQAVSKKSDASFWKTWKLPVLLGLVVSVLYTYLFI